MANLSWMLQHHVRHCRANICEVAMNSPMIQSLVNRVDLVLESINSIENPKEHPTYCEMVKDFNSKYSLLCKTLLQSCEDRPVEFQDAAFVKYLGNKTVAFAKCQHEIAQYISTTDGIQYQNTTQKKGKKK